MCASSLSHVKFFMVSWTEANQGPLPMEFYRQEYWSGLPSPTPGNIPDLGIQWHLLCLLHSQVDSLPLPPPGKPELRLA